MKKCVKCLIEKQESDFWNRSRSSDWLQKCCKECKRKYDNSYYSNLPHSNKRQKKVNSVKRKNEILRFVVNLSLEKWCIDCGYKENPAPLQFDHRGNKDFNVSDMIRRGHSLNNILSEIEKCDVRCANCHAIKTAVEQQWYKDIRD